MTVYSLYVFNRNADCLLYREWKRARPASDLEGEKKNLFGMLFALRNFCSKMGSLKDLKDDVNAGALQYYLAGNYALHYFETATGLRFILMTSKNFGTLNVSRCLREIYETIYVEYVTLNAMYSPPEPLKNALFMEKLDEYIEALSIF